MRTLALFLRHPPSLRTFMPEPAHSTPIRIAIIGAGAVSDLPPRSGHSARSAVSWSRFATPAASCSRNGAREWGVEKVTTDPEAICARPGRRRGHHRHAQLHARPIAVGGRQGGKHVMCEKPLGLNAGEVREMYDAARDAGVVHMTAFTYRFAPSMRYLRHLVRSRALGEPRHFRSQRFLDWPETSWGWRQYKDKAGAGDLFDMTIHRIDFRDRPAGPDRTASAAPSPGSPRATETADGQPCPPSEVDDWSSLIGEFACGATGVWEGTTLAKGYDRNGFGHEWAEINGSEARPSIGCTSRTRSCSARPARTWRPVDVPAEFLKPAGQPPRPDGGRAGHRLPLRPGLGIRLGDRRGPPGRPQLLRRPERPDRRRRRARSRTRPPLGRYPAGTELNRRPAAAARKPRIEPAQVRRIRTGYSPVRDFVR